jgi:hypothetical protein
MPVQCWPRRAGPCRRHWIAHRSSGGPLGTTIDNGRQGTRFEHRECKGVNPVRASLSRHLAQLRQRRTGLLRHRCGARRYRPSSSRSPLAGLPPFPSASRRPSLLVLARDWSAASARKYMLALNTLHSHSRPTVRRSRWGGPRWSSVQVKVGPPCTELGLLLLPPPGRAGLLPLLLQLRTLGPRAPRGHRRHRNLC